MTREEAVRKVEEAYGSGLDTGSSFIRTLEALGLLKFEEEKGHSKFVTIDHCGGVSEKTCVVSVNNMIEILRKHGYYVCRD